MRAHRSLAAMSMVRFSAPFVDEFVVEKCIMMSLLQKSIKEAAKDFLTFVNRSPSPYHGRWTCIIM